MFEMTFDAMTAFHQAVYLSAGLVLSLLGGAIVLFGLHTYLRALRVPAIITGVRQSGRMFYAVYRYMMPTGEVYETVSDTGSSIIKGKETGREVTIYVFPDEPTSIRSDLRGIFLIGFIFFIPGLVLLGMGLFTYPFTPMSWLVLAVFVLAGLRRFHKILLPKDARKTKSAFRAEMQRRREEKFTKMNLTTAEDYLQSPAGRRLAAETEQAQRAAMPLLFLFGLGALWGAWYLGGEVYRLSMAGVRTQGVIVGFETSRGSDTVTYRARVSFSDARSENHTFTERQGSSHPLLQEGEQVTVLYDPAAPADKAIIDRGPIMNALWPGLLGLAGLAMLAGGFSMWRTRRAAAEGR